MIREFDVCGPLPTGVTVLEASAGTGKTFTIAALAARYVASGVPLERLLLVTFTRMATSELRERVRERLVTAEAALEGTPADDDAVAQLLATGTPEEVALRRERLAAALADFDSATIATTHGFCQEVLGGLGVLGDVEADTTFVEDVTDLREEVVDDLYLRRFARRGTPQFGRAEAMEIARAAIENPAAPIEPADAPGESIAAMRVRLAHAAREELEVRKRRGGVMTYDDLLTRLDDTLSGEGGAVAVARLRERYHVVLVDEFQDTDPVQWRIMRTAFGDGATTLVLIGDPKQAIYAFRGADVYAYIEAARTAGDEATLEVNRRSDQALLEAYDALFAGAKLGHEGIEYRPVRASHTGVRLHGAPDPAPLRIRVVPRGQVGTTPAGYARTDPAREHVARDVAADIVSLLRSGAVVEDAPLRPGHIAVLVRTNRNAARVRDALEEVDVPAVINGAGSVFGTEPAREWLRLLEAIERPSYPPRARSAALTSILGWTVEEVASADDDDWETVHRRLHHWARVLREKGVATLMEAITLEQGLPERVLGMVDGERRMTDLRHVGELLHAEAMSQQMGATALTAWLRARVLEATTDTNDEERSRRLESDAEAVQVLTMHRSKGLEFPVVYYPDLWEPTWIPREKTTPVTFHDAAGVRTIDVGLDGPQWKRHVDQHIFEQRGEDLRLAYVALTRAKHQAVVWWAGSFDSRNSALSRLLLARDDSGNVAPSGPAVPSDDTALARFGELGASARVSVAPAVPGPLVSWPGDVPATSPLSSASFDRTLDWWWRRTSFSDITAGTYEPHVASEPEEPVVDDEATPLAPPAPSDGDLALRAVPSLLADMPVGVEVGTLVHRVFEAVDFASPDLAGEIAVAQARRRVELGDVDAVVTGLRAAIETPLGPLAGGVALRDIARADRLDELDFELPLVGGDDPTGAALTLAAIAEVLGAHGEPYAERLLDPRLRESVRGYLTGSIDLVVRLGGERFAVVDYKTNWLAPPGEELTAWHHRPAALRAEMIHSHYGLQALLYTVALHRYLRWRLPGYSASRNLAGVLYLFLRGMTGPDTPVVEGTPCGVYTWQPSAALVEALSDVLDQGAVAA